MTSTSSSQQLINLEQLFPKDKIFNNIFYEDARGSELAACVIHALNNAPLHVEGIFRIPIAPLLDQMRRISGNEDEADRCMEFIRKNLPATHAAEIGRVGNDDANYIIIYPRDRRPADFRKSKTNVLTVVELVKVALHSLENEVKPYGSYNGIKVTRSNLTTAREIAAVIREALPNIKIMTFADKYTTAQLDVMISKLTDIKKIVERQEAIQVLKERGFTDTQIQRLFPS